MPQGALDGLTVRFCSDDCGTPVTAWTLPVYETTKRLKAPPKSRGFFSLIACGSMRVGSGHHEARAERRPRASPARWRRAKFLFLGSIAMGKPISAIARIS